MKNKGENKDKTAIETEGFKILWEDCAKLYANKCQNLDEIDNISEKYSLSNLIIIETKSLNRWFAYDKERKRENGKAERQKETQKEWESY